MLNRASAAACRSAVTLKLVGLRYNARQQPLLLPCVRALSTTGLNPNGPKWGAEDNILPVRPINPSLVMFEIMAKSSDLLNRLLCYCVFLFSQTPCVSVVTIDVMGNDFRSLVAVLFPHGDVACLLACHRSHAQAQCDYQLSVRKRIP